jgi:CheY-like chemotaxis protein
MLHEAGYHTECTHTFAQGKQAILEEAFDLVVCNVLLPGGSGVELAALAKSKGMKHLLSNGASRADATARCGKTQLFAETVSGRCVHSTHQQDVGWRLTRGWRFAAQPVCLAWRIMAPRQRGRAKSLIVQPQAENLLRRSMQPPLF